MEMECPSHIGKYRNIRFLDEGGMGAVYLAQDPVLRHDVVIKQLKFGRSASKARERFKRELSIMNKLTSEHIVRSFEFIEEVEERTGRKKDYFVLEYVDGMSLNKLLQKDKVIPLNVLMVIFRDTCLGLSVAHSHKIIHRDIKPANILISKKTVVKLADFGIAGSDREEDDDNVKGPSKEGDPSIYGGKDMTLSGSTVGTLSYMAPEQMDPKEVVTKRADIYAMGITLYEMIYGKKPYEFRRDLEGQISMLRKKKFVRAPKSNGSEKIPLSIRHMIKKMTMFKPQRRYASILRVLNVSNRYLKNFDNHDVRIQLANSLVNYPKRKCVYKSVLPKNRIPKLVACYAFIAALLAAAFTFAWKQGFIHRTILRHWYTPVTISLKMPETKSVKADLPARAFFYFNDNNEIPDVPGAQRDFAPDKKGRAGGDTSVSIKPVYLKHGDYRLKIAAGPSVFWQDLKVGHDTISLDLDYLKAEKREIRIFATATDDETGEDISDICSCKIQTADGLKDLWSLKPGSLKTGEVYKIFIKSEGYQDEYFSLMIDWYQDELYINARMKKIKKADGAN